MEKTMKPNHNSDRQPEPGTISSSEKLVEHPADMANEGNSATPLLSEQPHRKPITSVKKMAANRLNSLKSTGPRTLAGKRAVRRNAIKHGFFSNFLVVEKHE